MLNIQNLSIEFHDKGYAKRVLDNFCMQINRGEIVGIAGESGSGKTMCAYAINGILPDAAIIVDGKILYNDVDLLRLEKKDKRFVQGREFGIVFQDPLTSLNPLYKVGLQVEENLLLHSNMNAQERKKKAIEMLEAVELKDAQRIYNSYPHELSGGMRQRVMLAAALIHSPKLLIADEPTTALDVVVQAKLIALIKRLSEQFDITIIFISHNLLVLKKLCDRIIVMRRGKIVEYGSTEQIFTAPEHEYTKELTKAFQR